MVFFIVSPLSYLIVSLSNEYKRTDYPGSEIARLVQNKWDENFTDQWNTQLYRQAQRYPNLPLSSKVKGVVSLYDVSDDWIPIYDKSSLPGFYMAVGSSGNQYKNAAIAGVMMAKLIEKCEKGHDHDEDPVKLHLKYINREIDIGFYLSLIHI